MQSVAAEMNLAETAFVSPRDDGIDLRWFTPTVEVDLCGHATLASAHMRSGKQDGFAAGTTARFHTRVDGSPPTSAMASSNSTFRRRRRSGSRFAASLTDAVRAPVQWAGRSRFDLVARLESADAVRRAAPDYALVAALPCRGVIVTAPGDDGVHDFVSRFFGPQSGVDEDPVTGSAHCALAPYWAGIHGRDTLVGFQASPRGGTVRVRLVVIGCAERPRRHGAARGAAHVTTPLDAFGILDLRVGRITRCEPNAKARCRPTVCGSTSDRSACVLRAPSSPSCTPRTT